MVDFVSILIIGLNNNPVHPGIITITNYIWGGAFYNSDLNGHYDCRDIELRRLPATFLQQPIVNLFLQRS